MSSLQFEEKILYKTRRHWIVPFTASLKLCIYYALPISIVTYFVASYSFEWAFGTFFLLSFCIVAYDHYLWHHSWLLIGNQKVTLSVRNGLFSQYAMNIRYRNVRDCAVTKNNFFSFLFKYGTIFIRSSANEGDFQAHFVPKAGKVYALVNALSRYSDEERTHIDSIEKLHVYHQGKEFSHQKGEHATNTSH